MIKKMVKNSALAIAATTMLLTGCQSNTDTGAETGGIERTNHTVRTADRRIAAAGGR